MKIFGFIQILFLTLVISSCNDAESTSDALPAETDFKTVTIADGLVHPWALEFMPDGSYLISERRGKLWHVAPSGTKTEITGVPDVYHEGQGGLLDIMLAPDFDNNGWIYFSYAAASPEDPDLANTEIARARLDIRNHRLNNAEVIFRAEPKVEGGNHWGSRLQMTPDGHLYATLGERYDYMEEAQNPQNHLGAVIRILPDGSVPPDNPFADSDTNKPEIFSYGHRNPQGMDIHPETGDVWIHEHGPKGGDEINILKSGANYGWPAVTFGISYWGTEISDKTTAPGMEDPVLHWTPSIAPSGMAFYTGEKFPAWQGDLFVGALAGKHLRRVTLDGRSVTGQYELLGERGERIRDVRNGPDGYLYVLTDERNGTLLRLEPQ